MLLIVSHKTYPYAHHEPFLTVCQDTLLHGETLLVVTPGDAHHVALPFVSQCVGLDLRAHALLVEDSELVLVRNLEQLLTSCRGIRHVQLQDTQIQKERSRIKSR